MSDSIGSTQVDTPLTDAEKTDIRYLTGYSLYGNTASGFMGYRFFQAEGFLEYRLTNASPAELQTIRQILSEIKPLRVGILGSAQNMDTDMAAVWTRNKNEAQDRKRLFNDWRAELCNFLGVPKGPGLSNVNSSRIVI
jgi:hypothetical protein